jgi:hypothetical protein
MQAGREWGEGVYHAIEGLAIIAMSAGLLVVSAWALARLEDKRSRENLLASHPPKEKTGSFTTATAQPDPVSDDRSNVRTSP